MNFEDVKYIKNYDGDTITVDIRDIHPLLGDNIPIRVRDIDAEELRTKSENAKNAKIFVQNIMENAKSIDLIDVRRGKYFRLIADVYVDGKSLGDMLVDKGFAIRKIYK